MINFNNANDTLRLRHLGNLRKKDRVETFLVKLETSWNHYKQNPTTMSLWKTIVHAFLCEYIYWGILNAVSISLTLLQPFMVKILIRYIKDGTN